MNSIFFLPHDDPDNDAPGLQAAHAKPPFVLVQSAIERQLWVLSVHSFTSGDIQNTIEI